VAASRLIPIHAGLMVAQGLPPVSTPMSHQSTDACSSSSPGSKCSMFPGWHPRYSQMRDRVIDLSGVASQEAHPMPLVLGKEAFNQLIIDIDFQHRKIAFYDPSGY
jgi:hypothetical protein